MKPDDFIKTAKDLIRIGRGKPRQTNLRRACSTTYYALFHTLCQTCAEAFARRDTRNAWKQVYRAVDHGIARQNCKRSDVISRFPEPIQDFADQFVSMQEKRHRADYDPHQKFLKSAVEADIAAAESAIANFHACAVKDRKAFAAYVLFKHRN